MTTRPRGRGGKAAKEINAELRRRDRLAFNGVLTPTDPFNRAEREARYQQERDEMGITDAIISLPVDEQNALEAHEAIIAAGLQTFYEVGAALLDIRDRKLYRAQHSTFEDYCRQRWNMARNYANKLIAAAEVVGNLGTTVPIPENERQARPLAELQPDEQRIVWEVVQETAPKGKVTAAHVKSVVTVLKEVTRTGALDNGEGESITPTQATTDHLKAAVTEETYERMKRQETYIEERRNKAYKNSSDSNEWYTPRDIIDRAVAVMGDINLDPATSEKANAIIGAKHIFTEADNGLEQAWYGRVWLNPPYGDAVEAWVAKLITEYCEGRVTEAILLVAARTDTQWFRRLRDFPRCFLFGRIRFINGDTGEVGDAAGFPSMAVYLGKNLNSFCEAFDSIGDIYILRGNAS